MLIVLGTEQMDPSDNYGFLPTEQITIGLLSNLHLGPSDYLTDGSLCHAANGLVDHSIICLLAHHFLAPTADVGAIVSMINQRVNGLYMQVYLFVCLPAYCSFGPREDCSMKSWYQRSLKSRYNCTFRNGCQCCFQLRSKCHIIPQ